MKLILGLIGAAFAGFILGVIFIFVLVAPYIDDKAIEREERIRMDREDTIAAKQRR